MKTYFVRIKDFDNSECIRKPLLPEHAIHAWCVKEESLSHLQKLYGKERVEIIKMPTEKKIFAIDFQELDNYVTGEHDDMPPLLEFDENIHSVGNWDREYQVVFI